LEPCIKEYENILKLLPQYKTAFNKPELELLMMEKEFMSVLINEYHLMELNLNQTSYDEFRDTIKMLILELRKKRYFFNFNNNLIRRELKNLYTKNLQRALT
jgi:hypothetical protein